MSKFTIKSHPIHEADAASFGKAYHDFVKRCWTDHKPNYSEKTINFLLDCAHIANGTNVKGLPQQGFKLTMAGNEDLVGDCLHLQYTEDGGKRGVDVWLNPHTQKALVDLYGFNPDDPYSSTHKEFSVYNYTADDFCEFIESLPNYKGESMKKESKMKIKVKEGKKNESAPKKSESSEDYEVIHGEQADIILDDDPNFQVTFRDDDDKVYTFYVNASDAESALDAAYSNFSTWHNLSIKGEELFEEDIPEDKRSEYTVVSTNYVPKVNVAVDPYNGEGIRVVRVPEWFLPALVNADTSGMTDEDEKELDAFEQDLIDRGLDATSVYPVCGPDGEYWDENLGDVLCSTNLAKK